jgi:hypothetical protein
MSAINWDTLANIITIICLVAAGACAAFLAKTKIK